MRDYLPKSYKLPKATYYRALYAVRDYERLNREYNIILHGTATSDGQPHSVSPGDPSAHKAVRLAELSTTLTAIDRALQEVPEEYRKGVTDNIMYKLPYPYTASISTWSNHRRRFLYYVAKYLRIL